MHNSAHSASVDVRSLVPVARMQGQPADLQNAAAARTAITITAAQTATTATATAAASSLFTAPNAAFASQQRPASMPLMLTNNMMMPPAQGPQSYAGNTKHLCFLCIFCVNFMHLL